MTLAKIDISTTPPLRFQYSAKDRPCVFSSQREFPLMFSIFGAFAPLRFQSINKKCLLQKSMFRQHGPHVFSIPRKTALAFSVVSVSSLLCFQYSAHLRRYVFSPSTKMSLTKIDVWTTPPLRFQYAAKDRPCVFSSRREFPLVFSIFGAFAPLRFQSIIKNVSYKNRCFDNTALTFSICCERSPLRFQ